MKDNQILDHIPIDAYSVPYWVKPNEGRVIVIQGDKAIVEPLGYFDESVAGDMRLWDEYEDDVIEREDD